MQYGLAVPRGIVCRTAQEAFVAAQELGPPVVVKAQVLSGGRGKAGGVKPVDSPDAARDAAEHILRLRINDLPVVAVLVVEALQISREYYLALTVNRNDKRIDCILSAAGGIDIEQTAAQTPQQIIQIPLDALESPSDGDVDATLAKIFGPQRESVRQIILSLAGFFTEKECSLVEINPLVATAQGRLVAADAKIVFDDNALYKHPEIQALFNAEEYSVQELAAQKAQLSYVSLDGSIGCMVNGAGLAMATMDLINHFGGKAANFLDVGGSSNPTKVVDALRILASNPRVTVILVNIFGGITRCDDIVRGILMAREQLPAGPPLVLRLTGTNEDTARELLTAAGISAFTDMTEAVRHAVTMEKQSHEHSH